MTLNTTKKFVIVFVEPETKCICSEFVIETADVSGLSNIVDPGGGGIHSSAKYCLDDHDLDQIESLLGIQINRASGEAHLRSWIFIDELPYKVHTNRELTLMLKGKKPLSVFHESLPSNPNFDLIPERFFAPYVEAGLFMTSEFIIPNIQGGGMRFVLYSVQGEEWRIQAYVLLRRTIILAGWNAGFTRMEGSLLGYEDWQNDIYIEKAYNR